MRFTLSIVPVLSSVLASAASSQQDVATEVVFQLRRFGPVAVTRMVSVPYTRTRCGGRLGDRDCWDETAWRNEPRTANEILAASGIRIVRADSMMFMRPVRTSLPHQTTVENKTYINCTAAPKQQQGTFELTFRRSARTTISKSVVRTRGYNLSFSDLKLGPFKLGGQLSIGEQSTEGAVTDLGTEATVRHSQVETFVIPARTVYVAELFHYPIDLAVPFQATVTVDADLSQNDRGLRLLSEIVPDSERTFSIVGEIHASDASDTQFRLLERPVSARDCQPNDGLKETSTLPTSTDTLRTVQRPARRP